jgi:hypothetical protein
MNPTTQLLSKLTAWNGIISSAPYINEIAETQSRLGICFPDGIIDFYTHCDGLSKPTDEGIWDFYSLKRLKLASADPKELLPIDSDIIIHKSKLVLFCDALIEATIYGFYADPTSPHFGKFYSNEPECAWEAASSYGAFVESFLKQDNILIGLQ